MEAGREAEGGVDDQDRLAPFFVQPPAIHFTPAVELGVGADAPGGYGIGSHFGGRGGPKIIGKKQSGQSGNEHPFAGYRQNYTDQGKDNYSRGVDLAVAGGCQADRGLPGEEDSFLLNLGLGFIRHMNNIAQILRRVRESNPRELTLIGFQDQRLTARPTLLKRELYDKMAL